MSDALTAFIGFIVPVVEACGTLVITLEVARTIGRYVLGFFGFSAASPAALRLRLGQSMVMGLEFLVAADILKTALSPTWNDILLLAALIGLRSALNYLLERELEVLDQESAAPNVNADVQ